LLVSCGRFCPSAVLDEIRNLILPPPLFSSSFPFLVRIGTPIMQSVACGHPPMIFQINQLDQLYLPPHQLQPPPPRMLLQSQLETFIVFLSLQQQLRQVPLLLLLGRRRCRRRRWMFQLRFQLRVLVLRLLRLRLRRRRWLVLVLVVVLQLLIG
jgi:hypothetical protein